jgi:hypothetical protein
VTAERFFSKESWDIEVTGQFETRIDRINAWDHPDCAGTVTDALGDAVFTDRGCRYNAEGAYGREDLSLTACQRIYVFDDEEAAEAVAADLEADDALRDNFVCSEDISDAVGRVARIDAVGPHVVATVGAVTDGDLSEDERTEAAQAAGFFHAEHVGVLIFS